MTKHWLNDLLLAGLAKAQEDHAAEGAKKLGLLRAGDSGSMQPDGTYNGKCLRLAALRAVGVQAPPDSLSTYEIFDNGFANEDVLVTRLKQTGVHFAREEECPIQWAVASGRKVAGRPDIVLLDANDRPIYPIELKSVQSVYSWRNKHYELKPDSSHLIQAAHPIFAFGLKAGALVYRSTAEFHLAFQYKWIQDLFGDTKVYDVYYKGDKPFKLRPAVRVYELTIDDEGHLCYNTEGLAHPVQTSVTWDSIQRYYEAADQLVTAFEDGQDVTLPEPPVKVGVDGTDGWKACDYCALNETCTNYSRQPDVWRDEVVSLVKELEHEQGSVFQAAKRTVNRTIHAQGLSRSRASSSGRREPGSQARQHGNHPRDED